MILFRKAVLIIHGFAGGTYDQEILANHLEKNAKLDIYSFTLPGHEKRTIKSVKYEEWINSCEKQIERLIFYGYKNIYVIGHSMGGVIATYLANKYKQVKKLVLVAPAFNYVSTKEDVFSKIKGGISVVKNNDKVETINRFLKLPLSSLNEFVKLVEKYCDEYLKLNIPTLIVHGTNDTLVPIESSKNIYNKLNCKKKFIVLDNITHDVFDKDSNEAITEIEKFLL